mmetsp:Transcript_23461/g.65132  ORF Transcript_23461/g.65132 Transcript_23461/m.65132 type:complete len:243 (+) Transcript_23461:127-855(+)
MQRGITFDCEQHSRRPHLHHLLQEKLPELGLDVDMYGPYVWGDEDSDDSDDDKDGDDLNDIVVGVLQASSETHADDDGVWLELVEKILEANRLDADFRREKKEQLLQETKAKMEEDLARAKLEEKQEDTEKEQKKKSSQVDEETKRRLMHQYGYDEPAIDEAHGSSGGGKSSKSAAAAAAATAPSTNRDVAKAANLEKARELRGAQKTTKAEERKKTKEQRASKAEMKEARRKRAQKGERKA